MTARWCAAILVVAAMGASGTPGPKTFTTPEHAAVALIEAAEPYDLEALKEILGPDGIDLVQTGDTVQDKNQAQAFAALAREKMKVVRDSEKKATLVVGHEDWPSPIPIVRKKDAWVFDTKAGRQEILFRRIGRNELDAIQVCRGYVEAQHEYALERRGDSRVAQYAQRIISTPGLKDGLVWRKSDGSWEGPVAEGIARAIAEGYGQSSGGRPYHGYNFKVLRGQGPSAPLGEMDYVIKGVMIGGFALAAVPATYGVTGIKSFIVSQDGVVYERDLGNDTAEWFRKVRLFDPDKNWSPVVDDE